MTASTPPQALIHSWPLPYESALESRPLSQIDLVVIHCTELPDLAMARDYGERVLHNSGTGNSGHYYLDRDGSIHAFVAPQHIAHHTRGYNPRSMGIELVNIGRYPHWYDAQHQAMTEAYTDAQIVALITLLAFLRHELPNLQFIAGHEDLDTTLVAASNDARISVTRKCDPGPLFPWPEVLNASRLKRLLL